MGSLFDCCKRISYSRHLAHAVGRYVRKFSMQCTEAKSRQSLRKSDK